MSRRVQAYARQAFLTTVRKENASPFNKVVCQICRNSTYVSLATSALTVIIFDDGESAVVLSTIVNAIPRNVSEEKSIQTTRLDLLHRS